MTTTWTDVFSEKNARVLFVSQAVSQICDKTMSIGLVWTLISKYSAEILPWFLFVSFLPHLLAFPFAPAFIQRWTPLKTVIKADFFRGLVFLFLFATVVFLPENYFLFSLFACNFLVGVGSSLFNPAMLSLPPLLVSEKNILGLNALIDLCFSLSSVFAATLAIFLLNHTSLSTLILVNAISFVGVGFYQMTLKQQNTFPSVEKLETHFLQMQLQILQKHKNIQKLLTLFFLINIIMAPLFLFLPWYAKNIFGGESSNLAWLEACLSLGSVIGGIGLVSLQKNSELRLQDLWKIISLFGIFTLAFSLSTQLVVGSLWLIALGISLAILNIKILTYFQKKLPEDELPSVMSCVNLISAASVPFSMLISAFILPRVHVPEMALTCGALVLTLAFGTIFLFPIKKETA